MEKELYYFSSEGKKQIGVHENLTGDTSRIHGNCSNIRGIADALIGDVSNISGNISRIWGFVSFLKGDVSAVMGDVSNISGHAAFIRNSPALENDITDAERIEVNERRKLNK